MRKIMKANYENLLETCTNTQKLKSQPNNRTQIIMPSI